MKRSLLRVDRLEDRCVPAAFPVAGDVPPPTVPPPTDGDDAAMTQDGIDDGYSFVIDPYLIDPNAPPPPPNSDPNPNDGWTFPPDESPVPPIDDPFWY